MEQLAFKDAMKPEIERKHSVPFESVKTDQIRDIAEKGREVYPRFSQQRLIGLLNGLPPDRNDRQAIDHVLDIPGWMRQWPLESPERKVAAEARRVTPVPDLAEGLANDVLSARFRNQIRTAQELRGVLAEALYQRQMDEEPQLFRLGNDDYDGR